MAKSWYLWVPGVWFQIDVQCRGLAGIGTDHYYLVPVDTASKDFEAWISKCLGM